MDYYPYPRRDAIKNYFPLPNEIFLLGLSPCEFAIYSYLLYLENRKTYQCYPSYKLIGKAVNMSRNTVRKYVMQLEDKQLITTEPTTIRTKGGHKQNGSLLYTIRPIQEAIDYYYERQMARLEEEAALHRAAEQQAKRNRVSPQKPLCAALESKPSPAPPKQKQANLRAVTRNQSKPDNADFHADPPVRKKYKIKDRRGKPRQSTHKAPQCGSFHSFATAVGIDRLLIV